MCESNAICGTHAGSTLLMPIVPGDAGHSHLGFVVKLSVCCVGTECTSASRRGATESFAKGIANPKAFLPIGDMNRVL